MEFSDISGLISLLKKNFVVDADINKTYLNGFTITPFEFLLHDIPKSVDLSELPVCEHSVDDNVLVNEVVMNNAVQCSMLASGIDNMMMMTNQPTPMTNLNEISQDCDREFTVVINKKKTRKIKMSAEKRKKKAKECMKNLRSQVEFKEKEKTVETDNNEKNSKKMELNKLFKEQGKKNNLQNQKIKAKEQNNKKNLQELERQKNRQIEYDIPVNVDSPELHVCEHSVINNVSTTVSEVVMNAEFPVCENNVVDNVSTTVTEIVVNDAVQCSMLSSGNDDMMMVDQPTLLSDFTDIEKECNGEFTVVNELQGGKKTKKPMSRKQRNEIRKQNIRKKREDIEYTLKANEKNKFQMKRKRDNPDYVAQANEKNKFKMQKTRENKEYTEKEYAINSKRKQKYRLCPLYKNKESILNSKQKQKYRLCPVYKKKEQLKNLVRIEKSRLRKEYRQREYLKNRNRITILRSNPIYEVNELEGNRIRIQKRRKVASFRTSEKEKDKQIKQSSRADLEFRQKEKEANRLAKTNHRSNEILKFRHNLNSSIQKKKTILESLKSKFINSRKNVPNFVCCSCEGLFFQHSVSKLNVNTIQNSIGPEHFTEFYSKIKNFNSEYICQTCKNNVYKKKIPKLATSNGLKFVEVPPCLSILSDLEERLCSKYIPFMQIRELKRYAINSQLGLKGSVVNIPININDNLHILPRSLENSKTVQLQLKRHIQHKTHYMFETIRPAIVIDALKYLCQTPLYIKNNIKIDEEYLARYNEQYNENIDFVVNNNENEGSNQDRRQNVSEEEENCESIELGRVSENIAEIGENRLVEEIGEIILEELSEEEEDEETMFVNLAPIAPIISDHIEVIAPGQNERPVSWHLIENFDELCFPKIFAGHALSLPKNITYHDRAKSECRRVDRRSCTPNRLLFMAKQKVERQLTANINVCLRKSKRGTLSNVSANQILDDNFVDKICQFDNGYKSIAKIRGSPAYWETKKKDLLALVRTLKKPTLFLTLSAAESWWPELLQALAKEVGKNLSLKEALELSTFEKTKLIRNDPVLCARYFDHRLSNFMKLIKADNSVFDKFTASEIFSRLEFQSRGSPHSHSLLWLKDAPTYDPSDPSSEKKVIDFVDSYICCTRDSTDPYNSLQFHKHTHTCYKKKNHENLCRFHFPLPVMPKTTILNPLPKEEISKPMTENYKKIDNLMKHYYIKQDNVPFETILSKLQITEEEYMLAIRSSINQARVFLKRSSLEVGINAYNRDILHLFESNMDIQFILEEYGLASYILNYVSKIESGLSKLLRDAAEDIGNGNMTLREKMRKISNVFNNGSLMSTQEAVYYLLSLPLSKSSRQVLFIHTGPIEERVVMLKKKADLEKLDPDSNDIYMSDIVKKYCCRPKKLENICLAEYAAYYHKMFRTQDDMNGDGLEEDLGETEQVGGLKRRTKAAVLRYRNYKIAQDPENYFRERVLLLLPFRNERDEIENKDCEKLYSENLVTIERNGEEFGVVNDDRLNDALADVEFNERGRDIGEEEEEVGEENGFLVDILEQGGMDVTNDKEKTTIRERYTIPKRVSSRELSELLAKLNFRQKKFIDYVMNHFKNNPDIPLHIHLSGKGGTGKSLVINTLYQAVTHHFDNLPGGNKDKIVVLLCAPCGMAAFLINGVTLHSAFALPVNKFGGRQMPQLNADIANTIREKLFHIKLLIIDEISMVSSIMLDRIDCRLRQIKGKDEPFGSVSVIAVGDLYQLPPVASTPIYKFGSKEFSGLFDRNPLWDKFQFFELTEVMRQKEDLKFVNVLAKIASGTISQEDKNFINTRLVSPSSVPPHAVRLYKSNAEVDKFNSSRISEHPGTQYTSVAVDIVSGKASEAVKKRTLESILQKNKPSDTNGLPHILTLKIGIKYLLTYNMDVTDGLCNGCCGILRKIILKSGTNQPSKLFFDFGPENIGAKARDKYKSIMTREDIDQHLTPIEMVKLSLSTSIRVDCQVTRVQFAMVCGEAITVHKSQGQTYNEICLDLGGSWDRSRLYVALSRVTKLSGLYVTRKWQGELKENEDISNEMNRLRKEKSIMPEVEIEERQEDEEP
uniref:ATP-dependent DNA helicase n=1 Tax=Cacopsylla melanoneura TaxID=428564 RepID=A0A8D8ZHS9_9HEMI